MKQIREDVKKEDVVIKSKTTHHSQTDAAKGFGGKFGGLIYYTTWGLRMLSPARAYMLS